MNRRVSSEIAMLLKDKGFDIKCTSFYDLISNNQIDNAPIGNYNLTNQAVSMPTIAEVVMWLYEKHGIWITVHRADFDNEFYWSLDTLTEDEFTSIENFNSPIKAYEAAIEYTLNNLI